MPNTGNRWKGLGQEQTWAETLHGTRIDAHHENFIFAKSRTLINLKLTPSQRWERKVIGDISHSVQNRKQIH